MQPYLDDVTRPLRVPVLVQGARTCRPTITRITGPDMGESFAVPPDGSPLLLGRCDDARVRIQDETVSRRHATLTRRADGAIVLHDLGSTNGTLVNGRPVQETILIEGDKVQVGVNTVFRYSLNDRMDEDYQAHLFRTSTRDALTGLHNRRYLVECLERDLGLARRHGLPMALVLADADHFKDVNDSFGHAGGDQVLRSLAALLARMQRQESIMARYGGEEFAMLLRSVDAGGAEVFAERLRASVEAAQFRVGPEAVPLTVSIGVAVTTVDGVDEPDALLEKADRYLYLSKTRGRNCVTSARTFLG